MTSDQALRQEAEQLYEQRLEELREQAAEEQEAEREQGIRSAIKELQKQRSEERRAEARREAAQEADDIARERYGLAEELEEWARDGNDLLDRYEVLDRKHRDALRRAGRDVGHGHSLRTLLPRWFAHRFGGFRSPTGILGTHPSGKERTLAERDPLASPPTNPDT